MSRKIQFQMFLNKIKRLYISKKKIPRAPNNSYYQSIPLALGDLNQEEIMVLIGEDTMAIGTISPTNRNPSGSKNGHIPTMTIEDRNNPQTAIAF